MQYEANDIREICRQVSLFYNKKPAGKLMCSRKLYSIRHTSNLIVGVALIRRYTLNENEKAGSGKHSAERY